MLHIESEEEVMALLFEVGHKTNMTSARFICRKKFSEGANDRLMARSRARVDVAQPHRLPEFLQLPRQMLGVRGYCAHLCFIACAVTALAVEPWLLERVWGQGSVSNLPR
jgi:hypothetical protein